MYRSNGFTVPKARRGRPKKAAKKIKEQVTTPVDQELEICKTYLEKMRQIKTNEVLTNSEKDKVIYRLSGELKAEIEEKMCGMILISSHQTKNWAITVSSPQSFIIES